jgi:hypothetical protein
MPRAAGFRAKGQRTKCARRPFPELREHEMPRFIGTPPCVGCHFSSSAPLKEAYWLSWKQATSYWETALSLPAWLTEALLHASPFA